MNTYEYNKENIDITDVMFSDKFTISNYLHEKEASILIQLGVPCGAMQRFYNGKELSSRKEHSLSDDELGKVRQMYVPINSIEELAEHRATHFCSYTVNPNYVKPEQMQNFMYRFNLLTDKNMQMFNEDEINRNQEEIFASRPITYETVSNMKEKYITKEREEEFLERVGTKRLSRERFYELLNEEPGSTKENIEQENEELNEELEM